ncbi:MAG: type II toxin-antitoxin system PemK/MazF family toxin [Nanoarchaeota archaeon]
MTITGSKQRPALIISNEIVNNSHDRICCLISTIEQRGDIQILKNDFNKGKLPFTSFVRSHRLFTIHEKIIKKKICAVNEKFHTIVLKKINEYLMLK